MMIFYDGNNHVPTPRGAVVAVSWRYAKTNDIIRSFLGWHIQVPSALVSKGAQAAKHAHEIGASQAHLSFHDLQSIELRQ